jgi:hypothetical protein
MTIAQQLKVKVFPFIIKDDKGNEIYHEKGDGVWWKSQWDDNGNETYFEREYGYWVKKEFNENGYEIYYEDSEGIIKDRRPKAIPEFTKGTTIFKQPTHFKINLKKVTSLDDVVAILRGMDLTITQYGEEIPKQFKSMFDKGLLIEATNGTTQK